ncbi:MAG: hypothetical protein ACT4QC_16790 [Planctomycetaceae bacterium]
MSTRLTCRCGWKGTVDPPPPPGQAVLCPACGAAIAVTTWVPAPAGSPPVPATTAEGAGASSNWLISAAGQAKRALCGAWAYVRAACEFYWYERETIRAGWRLGLIEVFPTLQDPELLRLEIRRPLAEDDDLHFVDGAWRIDLPDRCVVCSKETVNDWTEDRRQVLDPFALIAAPLAGVALAPIFALWFWNIWILPFPPLAGVLAGYALRRHDNFALRLKRCRKHADNLQVPELTVWRRQMTLRPGHREVKLAFLRQPSEFEAVVPAPTLAAAGDELPPETIALAEDVPQSSTIIHERPDARLLDQGNRPHDNDAPL